MNSVQHRNYISIECITLCDTTTLHLLTLGALVRLAICC